MVWAVLEQLERWQRAHLPRSDTGVGQEVLIWLLRTRTAPRPLKDLYRSSRFSEPTVRAALKAFVEAGLAEIEVNDGDHRNRLPHVTPRFDVVVLELQRRLAVVSERLTAEPLSSSLETWLRPPASGPAGTRPSPARRTSVE